MMDETSWWDKVGLVPGRTNSALQCIPGRSNRQKRELGSRTPKSAQVPDDFTGGVRAARAG